MKKRIINRIVLSCLVILLMHIFIFQGYALDEGKPGAPSPTTEEKPTTLDLKKDPANAFKQNPEAAWKALQEDPELMKDKTVLDTAFKKDKTKAVAVINKKPGLLSDPAVFDRFNKEVQCKSDCSLLNSNSGAKEAWFKHFGLTDQGVTVGSYQGASITTSGEKGMSFTIKDFPGAKVMRDGSLKTKTGDLFYGTKQLSRSGNKVVMIGGQVDKGIYSRDINVEVKDGILNFDLGDKTLLYKGSFTFRQTKEGLSVKADNENGFIQKVGKRPKLRRRRSQGVIRYLTFNVKGEILVPLKAPPKDLYLVGDSSIRSMSGNEVSAKGNNRVYVAFSEAECPAGVSCIRDYKQRVTAEHIKNGDAVTVRRPKTIDRLTVKDIEDGSLNYVSLDDKGKKVISSLLIKKGGEVKVIKGKLAKTKANRTDIYYTGPDGKPMLKHWSTHDFQLDAMKKYFGSAKARKGKASFVACEIGTCEELFAKTFGRIVGPKGKTPTTTLIVGGDYASTAKSFENSWCKKEGCIILSSRDAPPTTESKRLVVTGHHSALAGSFYRENPGSALGISDRLYARELPRGPVETVTLSACNTVNNPTGVVLSTTLKDLTTRYSTAQVIRGWSEKAPANEIITHPAEPGVFRVQSTNKGKRAWFIKKGSKWVWTTDGKNFKG